MHACRLPATTIAPLVVSGLSKGTYALTLYEGALGIAGNVRPSAGENITWHSCVRFVPNERAAIAYLQANTSALA